MLESDIDVFMPESESLVSTETERQAAIAGGDCRERKVDTWKREIREFLRDAQSELDDIMATMANGSAAARGGSLVLPVKATSPADSETEDSSRAQRDITYDDANDRLLQLRERVTRRLLAAENTLSSEGNAR